MAFGATGLRRLPSQEITCTIPNCILHPIYRWVPLRQNNAKIEMGRRRILAAFVCSDKAGLQIALNWLSMCEICRHDCNEGAGGVGLRHIICRVKDKQVKLVV